MLKFLISASLCGTANAFADGSGFASYLWGDGVTTDVVLATPFTVTDPISASGSAHAAGTGTNDHIEVLSDNALVTYVGLFSAASISSHTELVSGGPVTKVACAGSAAVCILPLYKAPVADGTHDVLNPVPEGTYYLMPINGNDLDYGSAILGGGSDTVTVTINPYISVWNGLQTANSNTVERGTDLTLTWDGYATGDIIEYRYSDSPTNLVTTTACPVDYHTITLAEATLGRGTISLKTYGATSAGLVGFAIPGAHTISVVTASAATYATNPVATATCVLGTTTTQRLFTVVDSDTITIVKADGNDNSGGVIVPSHEAGTKITLNYNIATASTAGMYVGLWRDLENPSSHVVDPDYTAGAPLSAAYLPVGVSGAGTIELDTPINMVAGNHIVYFFNSNDIFFGPIADTSYKTIGDDTYGPHVSTTATGNFAEHNTDIAIIGAPTGQPSGQPSNEPSGQPSGVPTSPTGQPTGVPTSSPSFVEEPWGEYVWTEKRHRKAGMCENQCSGHGTCEVNGNCQCFTGLDGEDEWTGPDCSSRTCPFDFAWVGASINSNNLHPWAECSNKGICDRSSGECQCFTGYEGAACQRTVCPDNCNDQGTCWPEKHLASKAGRVYDAPWDAMKHVGCLCDAGYRGPACDQQECPSGADPLSGYGNEAGRDCSGRGICDYSNGICACFTGFFGTRCQHQTTVM